MFTKIKLLTVTALLFLLMGCSTLNYPSAMTDTEVKNVITKIKRIHPEEKLYRQYVGNNRYIQFERIDESNVIYGWYTCTNCTWTRSKIFGVYDGSYLYMGYGRHEDFFLGKPQNKRMHPKQTHWSWSSIEKFQIEGRNLIKLGQIRKCIYRNPAIKEWSNSPYAYDGDYDCSYQKKGNYKTIYVSTVDDTLVGKNDSIVSSDDGGVKEKLKTLNELYKDEFIDKDTYEKKKQEILDSI